MAWFPSSKEFGVLIKGNKARDDFQAGTNEMVLGYFYGSTNVVQSYHNKAFLSLAKISVTIYCLS
jgi:hypothetical protein